VKFWAADLFCCAGGAAMGLHRAGFNVVGWDISRQPRYPFTFNLGNALDADLAGFDFVWASPPCQRFTRMNRGLLAAQGRAKEHPDLVAATREKLVEWGGPYIIENVEGAPLLNPARLCGSAFGLRVQRHRLFESNVLLFGTDCAHSLWDYDLPSLHRLQGKSRVVGCYGNGRGAGDSVKAWREAMGIPWMTRKELAQAIPPAYSEFLGRQVLAVIKASVREAQSQVVGRAAA
jgi:DNA (cytosine-5)-methyltransferase 1